MEDGCRVTDMTKMANVSTNFSLTLSVIYVLQRTNHILIRVSWRTLSHRLDNYITQFNIPVMAPEETLKMIETLRHGKATGPATLA